MQSYLAVKIQQNPVRDLAEARQSEEAIAEPQLCNAYFCKTSLVHLPLHASTSEHQLTMAMAGKLLQRSFDAVTCMQAVPRRKTVLHSASHGLDRFASSLRVLPCSQPRRLSALLIAIEDVGAPAHMCLVQALYMACSHSCQSNQQRLVPGFACSHALHIVITQC